MKQAILCKTKKGNGLKIIVEGQWYYTSWGQFGRMMNGKAVGCTFQTIDESGQPVDLTEVAEGGDNPPSGAFLHGSLGEGAP